MAYQYSANAVHVSDADIDSIQLGRKAGRDNKMIDCHFVVHLRMYAF